MELGTDDQLNFRDDPIGALIAPGRSRSRNGKITPIDGPDGAPSDFLQFIPNDDHLTEIEQYIREEIDAAKEDYKGVWSRAEENIRTYEALPDKEETMQLPVAKRDANYVISTIVNRIMSKKPIGTVEPDEVGDFEVPIPAGSDPETGEVLSRMELRSAEQIAEGGEKLLELYLRKRINFRHFLRSTVTDCVRGAQPAWGYTCYEPNERGYGRPNFARDANGLYRLKQMQWANRAITSPHKLKPLSVFDVLKPSDALDEQETPWLASRNTMDLTRFRQMYEAGEFPLLDDERLKRVISGAKDLSAIIHRQALRDLSGYAPTKMRGLLDIWNVYLYWPVIVEQEGYGEVQGMFSLVVPFDMTTGIALSMPLNPYTHGLRPLVPYFLNQRPHDFSSSSTVEDTAVFQKVQSLLFHQQVQNGQLANTVAVKARAGSKAWEWLKANRVRSGSKVPFDKSDDVEPFMIGRPLASLSNEIAYLDSQAKQTNVAGDIAAGRALPSRTSGAAVNLIQNAAGSQVALFIDNLREPLGKNLTMLMQNIHQWSVYGEEIPLRNAETRALAMEAIRFPADGMTGFSVSITASSDEDTAQFEFERDLALSKIKMGADAERAKILGQLLSDQTPPGHKAIFRKMFLGNERILGRLFELSRLDPAKFAFSEREIDEIVSIQEQFNQLQQQLAAAQQQLAAMQPQQGVMNAGAAGTGGQVVPISRPAVGGGVPAAGPAALPPGNEGMAGPPGDASLLAGGEQGAL